MAPRRMSSRLVAHVVTAAVLVISLRSAWSFLAPPRAGLPRSAPGAAVTAATTAAMMSGAAPVFAEEEGGLLNFGRIDIGGGFGINLDIPETGIINLVILISGLFYLLGPVLGEAMSSREQEIQQDIDDAIAKYDEAVVRLAEAEKNQASAQEVIGEIEASIVKDQTEFKQNMEELEKNTMSSQADATKKAIAAMKQGAETSVETFILEQAVKRGVEELRVLDAGNKKKFLDAAISQL